MSRKKDHRVQNSQSGTKVCPELLIAKNKRAVAAARLWFRISADIGDTALHTNRLSANLFSKLTQFFPVFGLLLVSFQEMSQNVGTEASFGPLHQHVRIDGVAAQDTTGHRHRLRFRCHERAGLLDAAGQRHGQRFVCVCVCRRGRTVMLDARGKSNKRGWREPRVKTSKKALGQVQGEDEEGRSRRDEGVHDVDAADT